MECRIEIPYGKSHISLFISNIPAWLVGLIVVSTALGVTFIRTLFNL